VIISPREERLPTKKMRCPSKIGRPAASVSTLLTVGIVACAPQPATPDAAIVAKERQLLNDDASLSEKPQEAVGVSAAPGAVDPAGSFVRRVARQLVVVAPQVLRTHARPVAIVIRHDRTDPQLGRNPRNPRAPPRVA
jgi:hypothetical protein